MRDRCHGQHLFYYIEVHINNDFHYLNSKNTNSDLSFIQELRVLTNFQGNIKKTNKHLEDYNCGNDVPTNDDVRNSNYLPQYRIIIKTSAASFNKVNINTNIIHRTL